MGADLKRKEARKRKFGGLNSGLSFYKNVNLDPEVASADEPKKKKSKEAPSPSIKVPLVGEPKDWKKKEKSAVQKAQRFIVFIGSSTRSYMFGLAVWPSCCQVIYLTPRLTSQYPSISRKSILNRSGTGKQRRHKCPKALRFWNLKGMIEWKHAWKSTTSPISKTENLPGGS